jgi:phage-related minor tail protein
MAEPTTVGVDIDVDTRGFEAALKQMEDLSKAFGRELTGALKTAASSGNDLESALRKVGLRIADMALQQGLAPLQRLAGPGLGGLIGMIPNLLGFSQGGVLPFAAGGVVSTPTFFPTGRPLGVMGEAGAEAILPLSRGANGKLGVAAQGTAPGVNITFNVTAQDAASFRKSEAQITGMLARAVSRGARTL